MKKTIILITFLFLVALPLINADPPTVCCEKLTEEAGGQWCQMAFMDECNLVEYGYTSEDCETSPICNFGTCVSQETGRCESRTPEDLCLAEGGQWFSKEKSELPQCKIGCCVNTGSMETQSMCSKLVEEYGGGETINFNLDITTDSDCRIAFSAKVPGACVLLTETDRTCVMLTQEECMAQANEGFHDGFLCTDRTRVQSNCRPLTETTCAKKKEEVYFVDSCGNRANIYDSRKIYNPNDPESVDYWSKIYKSEDSCDLSSPGKTPKNCGNCKPFENGGTTCGPYEDIRDKPDYGDNFCGTLKCEYKGTTYSNGDTWCVRSAGTTILQVDNLGNYDEEQLSLAYNLPGSGHMQLTCTDGKVHKIECDIGRKEICVETKEKIKGLRVGKCKANKWDDCTIQMTKESCMDNQERDCVWYSGYRYMKKVEGYESGYCAPLFAPGFDYGSEEENVGETCAFGNMRCEYTIKYHLTWKGTKRKVTYKEGTGYSSDCVSRDGVVQNAWVLRMMSRCAVLGDCGGKRNYLGELGSRIKFWTNTVMYD